MDKDLSEVPKAQKHRAPKSLDEYERESAQRNDAIMAAFARGGCSMKAIGEHFASIILESVAY